MLHLSRRAIDLAKGGLFAAFGSATDEAGNKINIQLNDEHLHRAAILALDELARLSDTEISYEKEP